MTPQVAFHFNVEDRLHYVCRLLRKATRAGARLQVTAPPRELQELDRSLWTFDPIEFVPHCRAASVEQVPANLAASPIVLLDRISAPRGEGEVLVNLHTEIPEGAWEFPRVIEVVSRADGDRQSARDRWRTYAQAGCAIERHEVQA